MERKEVKELLEKQLQLKEDDDVYVVSAREVEEFLDSKMWKEMQDILMLNLQMNYMLSDTFTTLEELYVNKGRNAEIKNLLGLPDFILGELVSREEEAQEEVKEERLDKQFEQKFKNQRRI